MSKLITNTIRHTGASVDALTFDANGNTLIADSEELQIGTGGDLKLYHNGTDSYIDENTGNLYLRAPSGGTKWIILQAKPGENSIVCKPDGNTELYENGSLRFHTYDNGCKIIGQCHISDDTQLPDDKKFYIGT